MKKWIALVLVIVLALGCLCGCGAKGKTLAQVKNAGKLVIATSPDFPPFENLENNEVVGIEIDIMEALCAKLGVSLEIKQMDFDSVLPGIQACKYDAGVSGITVNEKRQKNALFTDPYYIAAQVIIVMNGSDITCKADLAGKKISVQTGTTAEEFCMGEESYEVLSYQANSDAEAALVNGKVDAWVIDNAVAKAMVELYNAENGDTLTILEEAMTEEPYAFAFAFGSEDLVAEINKVQKDMIADGTVQAIFDKYGETYLAP